MSDKSIHVPEGMLKAALKAQDSSRSEGHTIVAIEATLLWLDEILHERNVDFHRAILEAEKKRCPGNSEYGSVIARRVDFEYGVSFARNYIRDLFRVDSKTPNEVQDLLWRPRAEETELDRQLAHYDAAHDVDVIEAFRRGQKAGK